jgi:B12-binding domain/radical SAM domain protein
MGIDKIPLIFRKTASNRFTIPVLLHSLEKQGLTSKYLIRVIQNPDEILALKGPMEPLVAYSFMTANLPEIMEEIQLLKRKLKATFIAGGPHPTGDPEGTLKLGFDHVFTGEGEGSMPDFCEAFASGKNMDRIPPINGPRPVPLDDSYPFSTLDPFIPPLEISRGCFYGCRFCQSAAVKSGHRSQESVNRVVQELTARGYFFRTGFICPSGFEYGASRPGDLHPERIAALLENAKAAGIRYLEYGIFPSEVRPNTVRSDILGIVARFCSNRKITLGAQSGSARILKTICRSHTTEDIEKAAALVREAGFRPQIDFILGFPGETEEDQVATCGLMLKMTRLYKAWNQVHYFLPLSGTPLYNATPAPVSERIVRMLEGFASGGVSNDWWKKGVVQSKRIVEALGQLERHAAE